VSTDLATAASTVDRAVQFALIDLGYADASVRRAERYRGDAVLSARAAGATWDQIADTLGGLEIADVLTLAGQDPL
jgi:hypothetical protein